MVNFENDRYFTNIITIFHSLLSVESANTQQAKSRVELDIHDIENIWPLAKAGLEMFYDLRPDLRVNAHKYLVGSTNAIEKEIKERDVSFKEERIRALSVLREGIDKIFLSEKVDERSVRKLKMNAPKNVIYDLLRQLKNCYIENGIPFLSQTNEALAEFVINHIEGFEHVSLNTITREISRDQQIMKSHFDIKTKG